MRSRSGSLSLAAGELTAKLGREKQRLQSSDVMVGVTAGERATLGHKHSTASPPSSSSSSSAAAAADTVVVDVKAGVGPAEQQQHGALSHESFVYPAVKSGTAYSPVSVSIDSSTRSVDSGNCGGSGGGGGGGGMGPGGNVAADGISTSGSNSDVSLVSPLFKVTRGRDGAPSEGATSVGGVGRGRGSGGGSGGATGGGGGGRGGGGLPFSSSHLALCTTEPSRYAEQLKQQEGTNGMTVCLIMLDACYKELQKM